ncbi:hypothetical protein D9599_03575 [Roseomonas sp. KE2513]|uniref:hypothetical protein n=1 Tax=Roseomonas sp. KE2513 TaxID=2479202 RepID=UPI0018DF8016|nr:hypothetical protein [Roseomonas sp. KE2513]MBI0534648.1 hypothetical protein [Roseomonas sp. KE2513]
MAGPAGPADLDAELIRLCAERAWRIEAANDAADVQEDGPTWRAYSESRDAIGRARPVTLAGMIAKARATQIEANSPDGSVTLSGTVAEGWARDMLDDLLTMVGRLRPLFIRPYGTCGLRPAPFTHEVTECSGRFHGVRMDATKIHDIAEWRSHLAY